MREKDMQGKRSGVSRGVGGSVCFQTTAQLGWSSGFQ